MKTSIIKWKLSAPLWTSDIMHVFPSVQMGEWDVEEPFCDITKDVFPQFYTLHIFWKGELEKIVSGLVNCEVFSRYTHCFWESIHEVHGMGPFCSVIMKSLNLCFSIYLQGYSKLNSDLKYTYLMCSVTSFQSGMFFCFVFAKLKCMFCFCLYQGSILAWCLQESFNYWWWFTKSYPPPTVWLRFSTDSGSNLLVIWRRILLKMLSMYEKNHCIPFCFSNCSSVSKCKLYTVIDQNSTLKLIWNADCNILN